MLREAGDKIKEALSVTEFVAAVNEVMFSFEGVTVEGEVADYRVSGGNKWVHFHLKDENSSVRCFMPKWYLHTEIEDGMMVKASGTPKLHEKWGFSFNVNFIEPAGEGALRRAFDLLKRKLGKEGLFAPERKRELPQFPQNIGLVTSREAAAYSDFVKVLAGRQGGMNVYFVHTQVQGEKAPAQITAALQKINTFSKPIDVIVLVRGGGGLEDLQAFNDEAVVRSVASSRLPIIVGVGHERDITLAELTADVRASTPSNAAEILVSSREEVAMAVSVLASRIGDILKEEIVDKQNDVRRMVGSINIKVRNSKDNIRSKLVTFKLMSSQWQADIKNKKEGVRADKKRMLDILLKTCGDKKQSLEQLNRMLLSMSPQKTLSRGYSITRDSQGRVVKDSSTLQPGSCIDTRFFRGNILATVQNKSDKEQKPINK